MRGELEIAYNRSLATLQGLTGRTSIGRDLTVLSLTDTAAQALVGEIDLIGGTVLVEGND